MNTNTTYEIVPLPNGGSIAAIVVDCECFFSPRHVCEELGLGWSAQRVKIMADPVLSTTVSKINTMRPDGSSIPAVMLPISMLSGWLFTIKKVSSKIQDKLNLYRAEGYLALDMWFRQGLRQDQEVQQKYEVPQTLADALRAYATQVEETEKLKAVVEETAPKAAVVDAHYARLDNLTLTRFCRTLNGVNLNLVKASLFRADIFWRFT